MLEHEFTEPTGGDVDKGWALLAVCWSFVLCAFVTTALRVFVRSRLTHNLGWDDFWMVTAMTTTIAGAAMITVEVLNGLGRHEYYLEPSQRRLFQAVGWADWIQTFITLCLTKVSICLFLLRIVDSKRTRIAMYSTIAFLVLFTTVCVGLFLGVCRPLKAYWDVGVDGVCLSTAEIKNVVIAQGVLSVITDLICAAFPIIVLRNLQVKLATKVGLCILMGLGIITAICCTVRTVLSGVLTDFDISWGIVANVGWRLPEVNIGIVCANAPILRPLYLWSRGKLATQQTASSGYTKDNMWPGNATKYDGSTKLRGAPSWEGDTEHTSVSVEMGLPMHDNKFDRKFDDAV